MNHHQIRSTISIFILLISSASMTVALAQPYPLERHPITAVDEIPVQWFGQSVAIQDDLFLVSAGRRINSRGIRSGAVYAYDVESRSLVYRLLSPDQSQDDAYGAGVALSDRHAVVGAPYDRELGHHAGAIYVHDRTNGDLYFKCTAENGRRTDYFGRGIDVYQEKVVVGAPRRQHEGMTTGTAFLFDLSNGSQITEILPPPVSDMAGFGTAAALRPNLAIISAPEDTSRAGSIGSVFLLDISDPHQPVVLSSIQAPQEWNDSFFGIAIDEINDLLLVGANEFQGEWSGAAYVYDISDPTSPALLHRLAAIEEENDRYLGITLSLGGPLGQEVALVGASGWGTSAVFVYDARSGEGIAKLRGTQADQGDYFGASIDGPTSDTGKFIIGARRFDSPMNPGSGLAWLFEARLPQITVTPDPLIAGEPASVLVQNAQPNSRTILFGSRNGLGSTFIPWLGVNLSMNNPRVIDTTTTDDTGAGQWKIVVPEFLRSNRIWFQVIQRDRKSNVVESWVD